MSPELQAHMLTMPHGTAWAFTAGKYGPERFTGNVYLRGELERADFVVITPNAEGDDVTGPLAEAAWAGDRCVLVCASPATAEAWASYVRAHCRPGVRLIS